MAGCSLTSISKIGRKMEGRTRTVVRDQLSQFAGQSKNSRLWVRSCHRPGQTSAAAPSTRYFLYLAFHKSGQLTNLTSWSLLRFCFILSFILSPTSHSHTALFNLGSREPELCQQSLARLSLGTLGKMQI